MKGSSILTTAITVVALAYFPSPSVAQTAAPAPYPGQPPATDLAQGVYLSSLDAEDRSLRRYAGQKLLNTEGAELGSVRDFIVHPPTSEVRYMVVSTGGLFGGMGNSLRLVPFEAVRRGNRGNLFEVDILQAAWLQIPPLNDRDYVVDRFIIGPAQHQEIVQRYRIAGLQVPGPSSTDLSGLVRASVLRGKSVEVANRKVGEIENIIIDLDQGTVAALLDSSGEFTGTRAKYLVPISRLAYADPRANPISTNLTREDFAAARPSQFSPVGLARVRQAPPPQEPPLTPTGPVVVHVPQPPPQQQQPQQVPPPAEPRVVYAPPTATGTSVPVYQAPPPEPTRASPPPQEVRTPAVVVQSPPVQAPVQPPPVQAAPVQQPVVPEPAVQPPPVQQPVAHAPVAQPPVAQPPPVQSPAPQRTFNDAPPSSHPNDLVQDARAARRAIDVDNTLIAENVLVIPENGKVYLRGTVRNEATRLAIDNAVRRVVLNSPIANQISVARTDNIAPPSTNER
jgi:sporulation protein YlmC with PRC-barrel domain